MQVEFAAHSLLRTQPLTGAAAGAQWPPTQALPVPQSASTEQPEWQAPPSQTPPAPHCASLVQPLPEVLPPHTPLVHTWPAAQLALLVQPEVLAGVQVLL